VLLSYWTGFTDEQRRFALLHDAAEAYLGDIPAPAFKLTEAQPGLVGIFNQVFDVIGLKYLCQPLRAPREHFKVVYQADKALVAYEVATFGDSEAWRQRACFSQAAWLELWGEVPTLAELPENARGKRAWDRHLAQDLFLERAEELGLADEPRRRGKTGSNVHHVPDACVQCGKPVEEDRCCYAIPTCYACLPPPEPLRVIPVSERFKP
jgi:hypothetical protein